MNRHAIEQCRWREPGGATAAGRIAAFLASIDIGIEAGPVGASVLPGMTVHRGRIHVDPRVDAFPGDLLHEAGHLAVCDPATRAAADRVSEDPGEEMAAIAWSVAAARACGIPLHTVFHDEGYTGWGSSLRDAFARDPARGVGVPLLAYYGMTAAPHDAAPDSAGPFPAMLRWLR